MATGSSNRLLPATFKDQAGREWTIRFNGATMRQILEELEVNICDAMADSGKFFAKIAEDIPLTMGMTWIAVRKQADERGVTAEDFLEQLYGQSLQDMGKSFCAAMLNFSQGEQTLPAMGRLLAKHTLLTQRKIEKELQRIEAMTDEDLEKKIDEQLAATSTTPTSGSPQE